MKIITIFGTRPEAIKMAPVVKALKDADGITSLVCVTAQHREMLDQVLHLFDITPDIDLDIMKKGQGLTDLTCAVLNGLSTVFSQEKPDRTGYTVHRTDSRIRQGTYHRSVRLTSSATVRSSLKKV